METRQLTSELNETPIRIVGKLLGITWPGNGLCLCPLHNEKTPSFSIKPHNRWMCFGCGAKGGAIDLVMQFKQVDFITARNWLAESTNLQNTCAITGPPRAREPAIARNDETPEAAANSKLYQAYLDLCPIAPTGLQYLQSRGISQKLIGSFAIGQAGQAAETLRSLVSTFGFDSVAAAGLLQKSSSPRNLVANFPYESLIFPFYEGDEIVYLQARPIGERPTKSKWINLMGRRQRIFNFNSLKAPLKRPFAICEGAIDTISAVQLGYNAVGILGVAGKLTTPQMAALKGRDIHILLDWDVPGEKAAKDLQQQFRQLGISTNRKPKPSVQAKDVNDYLMELAGRK